MWLLAKKVTFFLWLKYLKMLFKNSIFSDETIFYEQHVQDQLWDIENMDRYLAFKTKNFNFKQNSNLPFLKSFNCTIWGGISQPAEYNLSWPRVVDINNSLSVRLFASVRVEKLVQNNKKTSIVMYVDFVLKWIDWEKNKNISSFVTNNTA
jgi:hypothetical protein